MSLRAALVVLALAVLPGCAHTRYRAAVNAAQERLDEATTAGAATDAPAELHLARARLFRARAEGEDGSYGDGAESAEAAEIHAQKAIDEVRAAKRDGRGATSE
ncbi:MAG: hypothetical protein JWP97_2131 [Labilithrix sp.]|nr:hypothetical protein [Labilithrix sp.]